MDAIAQGRQALANWKAAQPTNWYDSHTILPLLLARYAPPDLRAEFQARLRQFGGEMAGVDDLVSRCDQPEFGPRLERFDAVGRRQERVRFDAAYHAYGTLIYRSGVMTLTGDRSRAVLQAALVHLASMHGEAGHVCPLACTAGLIKAIQRVGHGGLKRGLLPRLQNPDYAERLHGSQFLTEVQGGSDVGANACSAELIAPETPTSPARWAITGEKWFCSVVDAPLYLLTARPTGAAAGTRGIGLFVVPHDLPTQDAVHVKPLSHRASTQGPPVPNHFAIRRLKNKLGTRAMASGEVDWNGAIGWQLGELDRGFHNVVEIVLNTSRLFNAMACSGMAWRTFVEASTYAQFRTAFGQPIAQFASMDAMLSEMFVEATAMLASTMDLVALDASGKSDDALRLGINMNKYWTSIQTTSVIHNGIEVLGGNGTIEDFTPLPRLYRDAMVTESWEGSHAVLAAQTLRDVQRLKLHEAWLDWIGERVAALALGDIRLELARRHVLLSDEAQRIHASTAEDEPIAMRHWMELAMILHQAVCLAELCALSASSATHLLPPQIVQQWLDLHPHARQKRVAGWWPRLA